MSRCFPYPPPGYVRNPVAAAEAEATTKLQKEMEKAEKKKEKRSDKKAKQGEVSKHSKRTHKKRKHEDISEAGQESQKGSKEPVEQLEKSGLSEEHGAPCFIQMVHGSPESSQDSSKRRKVVLPSPSQAKNGNILRIKIRRDQDPSASILEKSKIEQQPVQQMGSGSSLISKQNSNQLHTNKVMGGKSASTHQQSIKSDSQALLKQGVKPAAKVMQIADLLNMRKVTQQKDAPSSLKPSNGRLGCPPVEMMASVGPPTKVMGGVDPPPAKATQRVDPPAKTLQRVDPPAKVLQRVDPLLSSKVRIDGTPSFMEVSQKETKLEVVPVHQNPKVPMGTPVMKQQQKTNASQPREEPCFSGRYMEAASVPVGKQSKSERKKSRRAEKKERKFKDLFVTWDPPSFEMEEMDLGDEDWLLGSKSKPDAGISNCREVAGQVPSHSVDQCSLQPRAIHLPDLHVYQLPYVVPF
ncbi:hypothetical protein ABZP36_019124 [Zizania latifolia]